MPSSLKQISVAELESEISLLVARLSGKECSVAINNVSYGQLGLSSGETLSFSVAATCANKHAGEPLPF